MAVVKESEKFVSNNVLEGMVSVRAVLESIDAGINSRRILTLYFAQEKIRSRNGDFRYLKARSYDLGYAFSVVPMKEIVKKEVYTRNSAKNTEIVIAKLGNDAGIIGAAFLGNAHD